MHVCVCVPLRSAVKSIKIMRPQNCLRVYLLTEQVVKGQRPNNFNICYYLNYEFGPGRIVEDFIWGRAMAVKNALLMPKLAISTWALIKANEFKRSDAQSPAAICIAFAVVKRFLSEKKDANSHRWRSIKKTSTRNV